MFRKESSVVHHRLTLLGLIASPCLALIFSGIFFMAWVLGQSHCRSHGRICCISSLYNTAITLRCGKRELSVKGLYDEQPDLEEDAGTR